MDLEKKILCFKNRPEKPISDRNAVYRAIEIEVARLVAHPRLFPNESIRGDFLHRINTWGKAGKVIAEGWNESRTLLAESSKQIRECHRRWYHKSWDPTRVQWHQFLHLNGPGSGMDVFSMPKEGGNQVLPHAGLELLFGWLETNEQVARDIKQVKPIAVGILMTCSFY